MILRVTPKLSRELATISKRLELGEREREGTVHGLLWLIVAFVMPQVVHDPIGSPPSTAALTAVALAGLLTSLFVWYSRVGRTLSSCGQPWVLSLSERATQTIYLRLSDPNARGRPRPRAPSARRAVA